MMAILYKSIISLWEVACGTTSDMGWDGAWDGADGTVFGGLRDEVSMGFHLCLMLENSPQPQAGACGARQHPCAAARGQGWGLCHGEPPKTPQIWLQGSP